MRDPLPEISIEVSKDYKKKVLSVQDNLIIK